MLKIYIVSLKKDIERRAIIQNILSEYNLEYEFIDAIYGKDLSEESLNLIRSKSQGKIIDRGFVPTPGEIGCTLSHIKAYQKLINSGFDWACILEDDAILDRRFKDFIDSFQSNHLKLEGLYLLGGQNGLDQSNVTKSIKNYQIIGKQQFFKTLKSENFIYRTCCYLVSSQLAKKLIDLNHSSFILADDWSYLSNISLIKNIYLADFVAHPIDLSTSNIHFERASATLQRIANDSEVKPSFFTLLKRSLRYRSRKLMMKVYTYTEKKED